MVFDKGNLMDKPYKIRSCRPGSQRDLFLKKFGKLIENYDSFKNATIGLSHSSINNYADRLPSFFLFLNEDPDTVIKNRQNDIMSQNFVQADNYERKVKAYLKILKDKNMAISSIASIVRGFFSNNSHHMRLYLGKFKIPKDRKHIKYSPTQQEVTKLYNSTNSIENKLIIALAYQNGINPQDVANLKIGEYPAKPWICYCKLRQKTGTLWFGVSTPEICEHLRIYLKTRKGAIGEPIFLNNQKKPMTAVNIRQRLKAIIKQAEYHTIPQFTPKCLRDGFADALYDVETYLFVTESLLGHSLEHMSRYGSEKRLMERVVYTMQKVYPSIRLTIESKPPKPLPDRKEYNHNYYKQH